MDPHEYERLKEAEKAHLRKVRALKEQLRDARRRQGLSEALGGLDTSALDDEFSQSLRSLQERNLTSEARFDLAMEALDEADERERRRLELEDFEAGQRRSDAADVVRRMKADLLGDAREHADAQSSSRPDAEPPARPGADAPPSPDTADPSTRGTTPEKTIGRARTRRD